MKRNIEYAGLLVGAVVAPLVEAVPVIARHTDHIALLHLNLGLRVHNQVKEFTIRSKSTQSGQRVHNQVKEYTIRSKRVHQVKESTQDQKAH